MKKSLLFIAVMALSIQMGNAQVCPIAKDSIIAGDGLTTYQLYEYDVQDRLVKVTRVDSGNTLANANYDTVLYGSNGLQSKLERRDAAGVLQEELTITYNGSDQITSMVANDAAMTWSMTHTITYNGNDLSAVTLSAVTGMPEGFVASFTNLSYVGGNLMQAHIEGDLTGMGIDTLELSLTYDTKNNLEALLYIDEAPDILGIYNSNNIVDITFDNQEIIGDTFPAGSYAMQTIYTYNVDNNVETLQELPSVFSDNPNTRQFYYDCTVLGEAEIAAVELDVFPNPFTSSLQLSLDNMKGRVDVMIVDILGKKVLSETYKNVAKVDLDELGQLNKGIYFLQVRNNGNTVTEKLIKE